MELRYRLGIFFIIIGLGFLFMYWITTQGNDPQPEGNFLIIGGASFALGVWQMWANRPKPEDVERFTTARKLLRREKKEKKK